MSDGKKPLWTCPKCGHQFVTRNMRKVDSPRFHRIESTLDRDFVHYFRLTGESQLDDELAALVREAYAVGCQEEFDRTERYSL